MTPQGLASLYEARWTDWVSLAAWGGTPQDAEDVVHDVMVWLLEGTATLEGETPEASIIRMILTRANTVAKRERRQMDQRFRLMAELPAWVSLASLDERIAVQKAVEALEGVSVPFVWGCLAQGVTVREAARTLGLSQSGAFRLLQGVVNRLRDALLPYRGTRAHRLRRS